MKKTTFLFCFFLVLNLAAQEHFSGINTSRRIGILNADMNPAELSNMSSKYEANLFALSFNVSNNKIGYTDIVNGNDIKDLIFNGNDPVNMRVDAEILGPGFALRLKKWSFGVTSKAIAKLNIVDVNPNLANSINLKGNNTINLMSDLNQRLNGNSWGEIGFSVARNLFENEKHKFNAGISIKLLCPASYTNLGLDKFNGTITNIANEDYLNNAQGNLNITYSGNLKGSFSNFSDYSKSFFGEFGGVGVDFGINYQLKTKDGYKINTGMSIRNLGSMTFKGNENSSTNYAVKIQSTTANPNGLALNQFKDIGSLDDVKNVLQNGGYLTETSTMSDFTVNLPTVFTFYADVKVISKFYVSLYTQQKIKNIGNNNQIVNHNSTSICPRFALKNIEIYSPWASNEISGATGGFGLRLYGFYLGSGSIVTAMLSNTKQADFYIGYRLGLK